MIDPRTPAKMPGEPPTAAPLPNLIEEWARLEPDRCYTERFTMTHEGEVYELQAIAAKCSRCATPHGSAHLLSDLWPDVVNSPLVLACAIDAIDTRGWRFSLMRLGDGSAWAVITDGKRESDSESLDGDDGRALLAAYLDHLRHFGLHKGSEA